MPQIFHLQIHEGADMKNLGDSPGSGQFAGKLGRLQHIAVPLTPGCIVDLGDNEIRRGCVRVSKAVVERNRIKNEAKMTELGQQPNRALERFSSLSLNLAPDTFRQWFAGIAKMICAMKTKRSRATGRPEPTTGKDLVELGQVEVNQVDSIAKGVGWLFQSAVSDSAGIDAAEHVLRSR